MTGNKTDHTYVRRKDLSACHVTTLGFDSPRSREKPLLSPRVLFEWQSAEMVEDQSIDLVASYMLSSGHYY